MVATWIHRVAWRSGSGLAFVLGATTIFLALGLCSVDAVPVIREQDAVLPGSVHEIVVAVRSKASHTMHEMVFHETSSATRSRRHLKLSEVCELFGPLADSVEAVNQWAGMHGGHVSAQTQCNDFVVVTMPTAQLGHAFLGAEGLECDPHTGCNMATAVPPAIKHAVDFVDGLGTPHAAPLSSRRLHRNFNPASRRFKAAQSSDDALSEDVSKKHHKHEPWYPDCLKESATPPCLKQAYNVTKDASPSHGAQGVALFGGQFFSSSDLKAFLKKYKLSYSPVHIMNDNKESEPGNEASLDVEYISGMANGVETTFMHYSCTTEDCKPFLTWIMQQANNSAAPLVQSVSVGTTEYEYAEAMGEKYLERINQEFMKAGMRGISLLFATGDKASQIYDHKWWINFPSASPYVTAVGGVWLGELGYGPLSVDPDTTGGFANYPAHKQLDFQKAAISAYMAEAESSKAKQPSHFNSSLRAVPDVSAMSDAYLIIQHGSETWIGGTSAACPVVAGIMSILNDERIAAGKGPMGYLNDFLYKNPQCFQDIVSGENAYAAVKGWDPASGLGTPMADCLLKQALAFSDF